MKNLLAPCWSAIIATFIMAASGSAADFGSPTIPVHAKALSAKAVSPTKALRLVTSTADDGPGSLRYAISNAAPGDTIRFAIGRPAIIVTKSSLVIDKDLTISGPGPEDVIVARSFARRTPGFSVFTVDSGVVTIADLGIINGSALNPDGHSDNLGGGILNWGTLTVSNCVLALNEAPTEAGGTGYGAGIFTVGSLTVLNSTLCNNKATVAGGGISTFHTASFLAEGCTLNNNFAGVQGGGLNFHGSQGQIRNCTISGNTTAPGGSSSALLNIVFASNESSELAISACTIARNKGNTNQYAAIIAAAQPGSGSVVTRVIDTLASENEPKNFSVVGTATIQSQGHNLDSDGTSGFINGVNGDIAGTPASPMNARLGPLLFNGGPTPTHALLFGSPALDTGVCTDANGGALTSDQRGFPRSQGAGCDIGAFENQPPTVACPEPGNVHRGKDLRVIVNDPDGDALSIVWTVDGTDAQTNFLAAVHPPRARSVRLKVNLSPGPHTIGVRVSDGKSDVVQCSSVVIVQRHDHDDDCDDDCDDDDDNHHHHDDDDND